MTPYTIDQLTAPATYESDPDLARFAADWAKSSIQIIEADHGRRLDSVEAIELVLSGAYAGRVHKAWVRRIEKSAAQADETSRAVTEAQAALVAIQFPAGVIAVIDGASIRLTIPRDGGLMTPKVKRLGGWWDRECSAFRLPLAAATSLPRVLKNWQREYDAASAERRQRAAEREAQRAADERRREAQRAERAAAYRAADEQERADREAQAALARANREQVVAGKYQVGDVLHGRTIKSFGAMWTKTETRVPDKYWRGELYEPCPICGQEPVELYAGVCERHHPHAVEVQTDYCYAYFI